MGISFDRALGVSQHAFKLRSERSSVLASNLANTDTPGYKARDFDFQSALKAEQQNSPSGLQTARTQTMHFKGGNHGKINSDILYRVPNQPSIDGNTVEEHVEHAEMMKNKLEFDLAFTVLNGKFQGLRKAITGE
ncbi:MAG: flagellar basal body rod protein FlgB [Cellvibrionaceae bacterium]|nr:flagellar basal body rod protein FlgB [Cellvibrionaceae bacterium]